MNPITATMGSFCATFLAAFVGSSASVQASPFYRALEKPHWAPPAAVFGPVWTVLYLMMAVAGSVAMSSREGNPKVLATLFIVQLSLNALWSWTFFKWESGMASMLTIIALWIAILTTMLAFWRTNPVSGMLMVPYFAWVTFAALLNGALWRMNPSL